MAGHAVRPVAWVGSWRGSRRSNAGDGHRNPTLTARTAQQERSRWTCPDGRFATIAATHDAAGRRFLLAECGHELRAGSVAPSGVEEPRSGRLATAEADLPSLSH